MLLTRRSWNRHQI